MATRLVLAELADGFQKNQKNQKGHGFQLTIESVGGVDATKRVQAGEAFDFVILASDAIDKLIATGHVLAGSKADLMRSGVAVAVRAGAEVPDISTPEALRESVRAARNISYSTGPSGVALARLLEQWGIADDIKQRIVQAPPGVPVGSLVARGEVALGFQQLSELMHIDGIAVVGPLPAAIQIITTFSAGLCTSSPHGEVARATTLSFLAYMNSADAIKPKRAQGMQPMED